MISLLTTIIDFFYPLFKRIMPLKTYRYAVCGGGNMVLDLVLYFVFFHFIVAKRNIDFGVFVMSPHIASLFFVWPITMLTGFWLNKYISFSDSNLETKKQFSRYLLISVVGIFVVYGLMKFFVDILNFYPTPSKLLTIVIAVIYSYLLQNYYSFRKIDKQKD